TMFSHYAADYGLLSFRLDNISRAAGAQPAHKPVTRATVRVRDETVARIGPHKELCIRYGIRDPNLAEGSQTAEVSLEIITPVNRSVTRRKTLISVARRCGARDSRNIVQRRVGKGE